MFVSTWNGCKNKSNVADDSGSYGRSGKKELADIEALAGNLEYRAQEAVERRIVGDEKRHLQMWGVKCEV